MPNSSRLDTLRSMLTYRRPKGSGSERAFIRRFIEVLPGAARDPYGNWHCIIGNGSIVWSAHLDTVHRRAGRQHVSYDGRYFYIGQRTARKSNCLGADCTAGVFVLCEMIRSWIPGHYVFHFGEESGGIGSDAAASHLPHWYTDARAIIAFDRRGVADIITHQCVGRTCSTPFAESLARAINDASRGALQYLPCPNGSFTDSANYVDLIGECTNVSVGYSREHSTDERLDTWHLFALVDAMIAADLSTLEYTRTPGEIDADDLDWTFGPMRVRRFPCEACGKDYSWTMSDASEWESYCSDFCERYARRNPDRTYEYYLSEEMCDVQRALEMDDLLDE